VDDDPLPEAFVDNETGEPISDAEVAEIPYTAFTSRPKREQVAGRLIARRVKRLNPRRPPPGRTNCSPPGATTP
jgi:hypothetical protein